jgi:hypothetical protein
MGLFGRLNRLVLITLFTLIETAALGAWLALVEDAPTVSQATALGLGILVVGLVVEHVLTDLAVNGFDLSLPGWRVLVFSVSETALWALWLVVAERVGGVEGFVAAAVVLAVLLVPQHTIEDNVLRGKGLFANLVDSGTVGFSILESAGATVWLVFVLSPDLVDSLLVGTPLATVDPAFVGLGILAIALFVEHIIGVRFSRRTGTDAPTRTIAEGTGTR